MGRCLVVTVGASLITNFASKTGRKIDEVTTLPDVSGRLLKYLEDTEPELASAEMNNLRFVLKKGDFILFLHSDTEEGILCGKLISKHYSNQGYNCYTERIDNLKYEEKKFKSIGLHSLVNKLIKTILENKEKNYETTLVATGGFKAELAYTTLIGMLFGVEVHYIHEKFKDEVILPVLPLSFDNRTWQKYKNDLEWLLEARTSEEIKERFGGTPPKSLWSLIEETSDKKFTLSPAGFAFYKAFEYHSTKKLDYPHDTTLPIEVKQDHRTLWGRVQDIKDIPDPGVRTLLERISMIPGTVGLRFSEFSGKEKTSETSLKLEKVEGNAARCMIYSKGYGIQDLTIISENEATAKLVRKMLGEKAYP